MLAVENATVCFGEHAALDDVDLTVNDHELVAVLGPSGSGKSTLLRAIAGLEPLDHGTVRWDGEDLARVPPHRRSFGLMFQDYALFPHKDVARNVAFGLRMQHRPDAEVRRRVNEVLALVDLEGFDERSVTTLSGGEQQRVALARAVAPEPRLLMLDEPLGALDRTLRDRLTQELRELLRRLGMTAIYVTHDHAEARALGDRLVVMRAGRIEQVGPPEEVVAYPVNDFVAEFVGGGTPPDR
jgi:thiamine transport system ATP-binding protein